MSNRREFLQKTAMIMGAGAMGGKSLLESEAAARTVADVAIAGTGDKFPNMADWVKTEAHEIMSYHKRCSRAFAKAEAEKPVKQGHWKLVHKTPAIRVPFTTVPMNMLMKEHPAEAKLQPPKIPHLLANMAQHGSSWNMQLVVRELWAMLPRLPGDEVEELTLVNPAFKKIRKDRVVTPKYVTDIEELTERMLARIVAACVVGIHHELDCNIKQCVNKAFEHGTPTNVHLQYRPLQVRAELDGFMWDCMVWTVAAGYVG